MLPVSATRALLQRRLRRVVLAAAAVVVASAVAACGGSGNSGADAAHVLSQTFSANVAKIHSGELSLTLHANLNGLKSVGGKPVSIQLAGPFDEPAGGTPSFALSATVTFDGQTLPIGVTSTGKALYLEFAGTYYALPASVDSGLAKAVPSGATGSSNTLSSLGINPLTWLTNPKILGTTTVGGVSTDHLTAQVDVAQLLSDVAKLASHSSGLAGKSVSKQLSAANLSQFASAIQSAHVDIYSGASDHILREFRAAVSFAIPPADKSAVDGLTGGSLTVDVTITDLNAPETITPPASSEPFSDLVGGGGLPSL
jgi:hypothetical protein